MVEESLQEEYARLLREGKTSEATQLVKSDSTQDKVVEDDEEEVVEKERDDVPEQERFAELKGVGDELAEEMVQVFGTYDSFVEDADMEGLVDISGVGESRAESLLEQME